MTPAQVARLYRSRHESNSRSSNETSLTNSTGTPWSHVWNHLDLDVDDTSFNNETVWRTSWQEEAHWMSFRNAVQQFASLKLTDEEFLEADEDELSDEEVSPKPPSPSSSTVSSLASDLAETKMRLALAQAERDELEFALLQRQT
jgi:hypothetical protein